LFLALSYLTVTTAVAQTMQATIRVGTTPRTIDVYLKPSASFSQKDEAMTFTLAIPATIGPAPTQGSSGAMANGTGAYNGISGVAPTLLVNNLGSTSRELVVSTQTINGIQYYVYTFIFSGTATSNHIWTANTEQLIFSVQFNGCNSNCEALSSTLMVSLPNGGAQGNSYFYFQPNTIGDITNYPAPFYANEQGGTVVNGGSSDGSALSYIALGMMVPLPVNLTSFNAREDNCIVTINWQTSGEYNAGSFNVQRSVNGTTFTTAANVHANGTTSADKTYSAIDNSAPTGNVYYRLQIVDKDGKNSFSKIQRVHVNCSRGSIIVHPTITPGPVQVFLPAGYEKATVVVLNALGEQLMASSAGTLNRSINLSMYAGGSYMINVIKDGKLINSFKVVVHR